MRLPFLALFLLALAGCANPGLVAESAPDLHRGAVAAAAQTDATFAATNSSGRSADMDRLLLAAEAPEQALPTISNDQFILVIESETQAQWRDLFAAITGYTGSLVKLADPALAAGVGADLTAAGNSFNALAGGSASGGAIAGFVGTVGSAIVSAAGERKAINVMGKVDPAFYDLLTSMADTLGKTDDDGLRGTVAGTWNDAKLQVLRTRYGSLPRGPEYTAARRLLLQDYVANLQQRDAALAALANLRQSMIALAEAHRAIVQNRDFDANAWLDRIDRFADDIALQLKPK